MKMLRRYSGNYELSMYETEKVKKWKLILLGLCIYYPVVKDFFFFSVHESLFFLPFFVDVTAIMFVSSSAYFVAFRVLFKLHLTVLKH